MPGRPIPAATVATPIEPMPMLPSDYAARYPKPSEGMVPIHQAIGLFIACPDCGGPCYVTEQSVGRHGDGYVMAVCRIGRKQWPAYQAVRVIEPPAEGIPNPVPKYLQNSRAYL
jgi:hypothetical protein